ncbi:ALBINO3-like protein 2 chloroplastic [Bienertia sinuspersici]
MASSKLLSTHLRRTSFSLLRPFLLSLSPPSSPPSPSPSPTTFIFNTSSRYFSSSQPSDSHFTHNLNSVTESELHSLGFIDGSQASDIVDKLLDDSILPINFIVSLLDGYHHLSGLPW